MDRADQTIGVSGDPDGKRNVELAELVCGLANMVAKCVSDHAVFDSQIDVLDSRKRGPAAGANSWIPASVACLMMRQDFWMMALMEMGWK